MVDGVVDPHALIAFTGPFFIGIILTWCLFGVLSVQVYLYSVSGRKEKRWLKLLVTWTYCWSIVQLVTGTRWVWKALVYDWGTSDMILAGNAFPDATDVVSVPVTDGIIAATVQLFLTWRIWTLARAIYARLMCGVILLASAIAFVAAMYVSVKGSIRGDEIGVLSLKPAITIWLTANIVADVLIALTLCTVLIQTRRKSGFRSTELLINKIIYITLETGLVTALVAPLHLWFFYGMRNYIHLVCSMVLGKLYANVLLVTLNARDRQFGTHSSAEPDPVIFTTFLSLNQELSSPTWSASDGRRDTVNTAKEIKINTDGRLHKENFNVTNIV